MQIVSKRKKKKNSEELKVAAHVSIYVPVAVEQCGSQSVLRGSQGICGFIAVMAALKYT